jgi:3-oxoadipate enol-lactonase
VPRIDADGVELFYESLGEGTPLILQAHDHSPWLFFQAPYFAQFYRVITFDRRGTGRSASPPGPWCMADFARDLRALLDALGIERAIIGGSSLGGIVAAQFGVDYPDRALALIIGHTVPASKFIMLRDTYHAAPRENALVWNKTVHAFLERHNLGGCASH